MNVNRHPKPGMPWVENLPALRHMGVVLPPSTVVSDLSRDEPVTEAELKLIGCLLGDTIAGILNPEHQEDDEQ